MGSKTTGSLTSQLDELLSHVPGLFNGGKFVRSLPRDVSTEDLKDSNPEDYVVCGCVLFSGSLCGVFDKLTIFPNENKTLPCVHDQNNTCCAPFAHFVKGLTCGHRRGFFGLSTGKFFRACEAAESSALWGRNPQLFDCQKSELVIKFAKHELPREPKQSTSPCVGATLVVCPIFHACEYVANVLALKYPSYRITVFGSDREMYEWRTCINQCFSSDIVIVSQCSLRNLCNRDDLYKQSFPNYYENQPPLEKVEGSLQYAADFLRNAIWDTVVLLHTDLQHFGGLGNRILIVEDSPSSVNLDRIRQLLRTDITLRNFELKSNYPWSLLPKNAFMTHLSLGSSGISLVDCPTLELQFPDELVLEIPDPMSPQFVCYDYYKVPIPKHPLSLTSEGGDFLTDHGHSVQFSPEDVKIHLSSAISEYRNELKKWSDELSTAGECVQLVKDFESRMYSVCETYRESVGTNGVVREPVLISGIKVSVAVPDNESGVSRATLFVEIPTGFIFSSELDSYFRKIYSWLFNMRRHHACFSSCDKVSTESDCQSDVWSRLKKFLVALGSERLPAVTEHVGLAARPKSYYHEKWLLDALNDAPYELQPVPYDAPCISYGELLHMRKLITECEHDIKYEYHHSMAITRISMIILLIGHLEDIISRLTNLLDRVDNYLGSCIYCFGCSKRIGTGQSAKMWMCGHSLCEGCCIKRSCPCCGCNYICFSVSEYWVKPLRDEYYHRVRDCIEYFVKEPRLESLGNSSVPGELIFLFSILNDCDRKESRPYRIYFVSGQAAPLKCQQFSLNAFLGSNDPDSIPLSSDGWRSVRPGHCDYFLPTPVNTTLFPINFEGDDCGNSITRLRWPYDTRSYKRDTRVMVGSMADFVVATAEVTRWDLQNFLSKLSPSQGGSKIQVFHLEWDQPQS